MPLTNEGTPWHSSQYSALPEIYAQDASLELAWTNVPVEKNSIAGDSVIPFVSKGYEGFDINNLEDWLLAETLIKEGEVKLPLVNIKKF